MTAVITRAAPPNRLAKLIRMPGGVTLAEALSRAQENVAGLAEPALALLDAELARLADAGARLLAAPDDAVALQTLYASAAEIAAIAEVAGQKPVGQAAWSVCDLADRFREPGRFSAPALHVHLTALRRLRAPATDGDGPARTAMLEGLTQVVQTI